MRSHIGRLPVEVTRPETAKFRHPILFLHGLWTGGWIWGRLASYLAQRGWESWAPSLLEGAPPQSFAAAVADVEHVVRRLPASPIVVAHDTGVVMGTSHAARWGAPALVVIAPVVSACGPGLGSDLLAWRSFWRVRVWGTLVRPPRGRAAAAFLGDAGAVYRDQLTPDSGPTFRALARRRLGLPDALGCPGLVLSGEHDQVSPVRIGAELARRYGWAQRVYPGREHFPMLERGWDEVAAAIHRWIVQTLGTALLALVDEDEQP